VQQWRGSPAAAALILSAIEGEARHGPYRQAKDLPSAPSRRTNRPEPGRRPRSARRSTEYLSEEEIAAVEASEMEPGFEHLDAELERAGTSVVEVGVDFGRKLRARGDAAKGRPADKAFRDSLFDDS
jgi:hypothetical protein